MAKPYFARASEEGKTDMCTVKQRTHVGVPLIREDRPPYRREWVIPPKAAYLEGAQPKSEPTLPWQLRDPTPSISEEEDGSSSGTDRSLVDPKSRPAFHPTRGVEPSLPATTAVAFAHIRSVEFQEALSQMKDEDEEEGREGIAKAIDDAARAVAATAEFRLVCDQIRARQEQRAQQGQESLSFVEQMAEYLNQAKAGPQAGPPIPPPPLAPTQPKMPLSPPPKPVPVPLPPVPQKANATNDKKNTNPP